LVHQVQAQLEQFELQRHKGEGKFQITASCPEVPADKRDVPLLIVTDADMSVGLAAEIARLRAFGDMHPKVMVVGVGYGAGYQEFAKYRTPDLTPPMSQAGTEALGNLSSFIGDQSGNADDFLDFIIDVLVPEVARRYPQTSEGQRLLYGHSWSPSAKRSRTCPPGFHRACR
jgi:predicted alpha/beta superfamily hydrolase